MHNWATRCMWNTCLSWTVVSSVHQQSVFNKLTGRHWCASGKAAPLFGALAPAAQTLGQAFSRRPASGASAPSQRAAAPTQLTLPESALAAELPQDVMESNWEDEEGGFPALPQLTDAQWAQVAKVSRAPCVCLSGIAIREILANDKLMPCQLALECIKQGCALALCWCRMLARLSVTSSETYCMTARCGSGSWQSLVPKPSAQWRDKTCPTCT